MSNKKELLTKNSVDKQTNIFKNGIFVIEDWIQSGSCRLSLPSQMKMVRSKLGAQVSYPVAAYHALRVQCVYDYVCKKNVMNKQYTQNTMLARNLRRNGSNSNKRQSNKKKKKIRNCVCALRHTAVCWRCWATASAAFIT